MGRIIPLRAKCNNANAKRKYEEHYAKIAKMTTKGRTNKKRSKKNTSL